MATMLNSIRLSARAAGARAAALSRPVGRRGFAGDDHAAHHQHVEDWKKYTFIFAIPVTCVFVKFMLTPHAHAEAPPEYPYLRIRNKPFPWGDQDLLDTRHLQHHADDHH